MSLLMMTTDHSHELAARSFLAAEPFRSASRYRRYLLAQYAFYADVLPLASALDRRTPISITRFHSRYEALTMDMQDIGVCFPEAAASSTIDGTSAISLPEALGWFFVAERLSRALSAMLGAVSKLGFTVAFGARHLSFSRLDRANSWCRFRYALNSVKLTGSERLLAANGAGSAYDQVLDLIDTHLARGPCRGP